MSVEDADVDTIWRNGAFLDWDDATVHELSQVATAGAGVFEGTRSYPTADGHAVFRLDDHLQRLHDSASLLDMDPEYSTADLASATREVARRNGLADVDGSVYFRHSVSYGYGGLGDPSGAPLLHTIAAFPFGRLWGEDAFENGAAVTISPWRRVHSSQFPVRAKANGLYLMSRLSRRRAQADGYDDALLLDVNGNVAEGTNANVFLVRDGRLYTPDLESSILPGITRRTLRRVARDRGYEVVETTVTTGDLLTADEVFLCGTGAEVTPVRRVDDTVVGDGAPGPVTEALQDAYLDVVHGREEAYEDWLTPV